MDFTADKQLLSAALDGLAPRDMHTRLYLAIDRAVELAQRFDASLPVRRVIVVLSDGKDEGSALTPEDVLLKMRASQLPIYSIGLSRLPAAEKQRYLDVLHRFSNVSGGLYEEAATGKLSQLYAAIQQAILRVFTVHLACASCPADGRSYPLEVTLTQGARGLKAVPLEVIPLAGPRPPPVAVESHWWSRMPFWVWLLAGVAVVAAGGFVVLRRRQASSSPPIPQDANRGSLGLTAAEFKVSQQPESKEGKPIKLTVVVGKDAGSSYELRLQNKAVIGRASDCDLVMPMRGSPNTSC